MNWNIFIFNQVEINKNVKFADIDITHPVSIRGLKNTKGVYSKVAGCEEISVKNTADFLAFVSKSKFSDVIEDDLQSTSDTKDTFLSSWMNIVDFREMITEYEQNIAKLTEKWQSFGANQVEINFSINKC